MHLLVHSGWESGYGPRPGSRFGLIPTSLSPPRHAPHRLPSPSPLSPASFSGLAPRLVVVHSRNGVEKLLDHGISYPPLVGGEIEPGPTAVSASTRPSLPLPLPFQIQTSYRCFPRPSRLRSLSSSTPGRVVSGHLDNSTPICGTRLSPEMDTAGNGRGK